MKRKGEINSEIFFFIGLTVVIVAGILAVAYSTTPRVLTVGKGYTIIEKSGSLYRVDNEGHITKETKDD